MKSEIELEITITGDLDVVMRDLLRLREAGAEITASITTAVFVPPDQRRVDSFNLPIFRPSAMVKPKRRCNNSTALFANDV